MPFKKNDKNINRKGRRPGSKNKVPSDKDIQDAFLKEALPTLNKLVAIRDDPKSKHLDVIKVSCKILDITYKIIVDREENLGIEYGPKGKISKEVEDEGKKEVVSSKFSLKAIK